MVHGPHNLLFEFLVSMFITFSTGDTDSAKPRTWSSFNLVSDACAYICLYACLDVYPVKITLLTALGSELSPYVMQIDGNHFLVGNDGILSITFLLWIALSLQRVLLIELKNSLVDGLLHHLVLRFSIFSPSCLVFWLPSMRTKEISSLVGKSDQMSDLNRGE